MCKQQEERANTRERDKKTARSTEGRGKRRKQRHTPFVPLVRIAPLPNSSRIQLRSFLKTPPPRILPRGGIPMTTTLVYPETTYIQPKNNKKLKRKTQAQNNQILKYSKENHPRRRKRIQFQNNSNLRESRREGQSIK